MADHFHILWACPLIQLIFHLKIDFSFSTLYLGKIPVGLMAQDNYLYKVLLVASKRAITQQLLQTNLPSRNDWITIVNEIQYMGKLTFTLSLRSDQYTKYHKVTLTPNSLSVWLIIPFCTKVQSTLILSTCLFPYKFCLFLFFLSFFLYLSFFVEKRTWKKRTLQPHNFVHFVSKYFTFRLFWDSLSAYYDGNCLIIKTL